MKTNRQQGRYRQAGVTAVEVAIGSILFFSLLLGVMELARGLYMWSTMLDITHRAARSAAMADIGNSNALELVRREAMSADRPGGLPLAGNVTPDKLQIDYLNAERTPISGFRACPETNLINCTLDPQGPSCIRYVRVRLCVAQTGSCERLPYEPLLAPGLLGGQLRYPTFSTTLAVGLLGRKPGAASTCL